MKKILSLLAAVLFAALPAAAAANLTEAEAKVRTQEYKLSGFRSLDISWVYRVELTQSSKYSVRVEAPEDLMDHLDIKVVGSTLKLGTKNTARSLRLNDRNNVRVYISMPSVSEIEMSGASRLTAVGQFNARKEFKLDMSGSTHAEGLYLKCDQVEIDCSGSSRFDLRGDFDKLELDMSGASNATLNGDVKNAEIDMSGAAKLTQRGKIGTLEIDASGSANYNLSGSLNMLEVEASGAAKINTLEASANQASIRMSGAANASIDVQKELSVHLDGAASCRYRSADKARIVSQSVGRGASLSKL